MQKKITFNIISHEDTFKPLPFFKTAINEITMQTVFITGEKIQPRIVANSIKGCGIILSAVVKRIIKQIKKNTLHIKVTLCKKSNVSNFFLPVSLIMNIKMKIFKLNKTSYSN